jgi:hypothetical protein
MGLEEPISELQVVDLQLQKPVMGVSTCRPDAKTGLESNYFEKSGRIFGQVVFSGSLVQFTLLQE